MALRRVAKFMMARTISTSYSLQRKMHLIKSQKPHVQAHVIQIFVTLMAMCSMKSKHIVVEKMLKSTIATQTECVVFLPGRASRCVIMTIAFAQATVLCKSFVRRNYYINSIILTCFPMLVSPRASRRLCTGLTIQLIRGSRRI